jgi:hypothetical protein
MSGIRYLLDTNAVIAIVKGNGGLLDQLNTASFVAFSVVTVIEFLSFPHLSEKDKTVFEEIVTEGTVINLDYGDENLMDSIVNIRKTYHLKLPDAVLAATALTYDCHFVSNDKELSKVPDLTIVRF